MYNFGHTWHELPPQAIEEQEARRTDDPWEYYIKNFIISKDRVETSEILSVCLKIENGKQTRFDTIRVGKILKMLKWERKHIMESNQRKYVYTPPPIPKEEIPEEITPEWSV